jgi:hypothetical protein
MPVSHLHGRILDPWPADSCRRTPTYRGLVLNAAADSALALARVLVPGQTDGCSYRTRRPGKAGAPRPRTVVVRSRGAYRRLRGGWRRFDRGSCRACSQCAGTGRVRTRRVFLSTCLSAQVHQVGKCCSGVAAQHSFIRSSGGGCEIRTHEGCDPLPDFKSGAIDRSANPPGAKSYAFHPSSTAPQRSPRTKIGAVSAVTMAPVSRA